MSSHDRIEAAHRRFLDHRLESGRALELADILEASKLIDEASGMRTYARLGDGARFALQDDSWKEVECIVSRTPPLNCEVGQLWFDVVELNIMVLIPGRVQHDATMASWVGTHPVRTWQLRVFMSMVQWRQRSNPFLRVADLMTSDRFRVMPELQWASNAYHEEAVAYAHWFGKTLVGALELRRAESFLGPERFMKMLPPELRLWSEVDVTDSEFVRLAVGGSSLHKDPEEELPLRETGENEALPDRMLFEEWDTGANIGFSTKIANRTGLLRNVPMRAFEFVELENVAPRTD